MQKMDAEMHAMRERIADNLLGDVDERFNFDHFWYLVDHGTPQIAGGVEDQKAREFLREWERRTA